MSEQGLEITSEITENSVSITGKAKQRLKNLKPWPKGVSGNPGGRPKGIFGKAALRQLRKRAENGETNLEALIGAQVLKAIHKGDTRAAEFLRDTVDGRPVSAGIDGANIGQVNIIWPGPAPEWAVQPEADAEIEPSATIAPRKRSD